MKKLGFVVALLAAGVIVASGLFAQDIKFDGYVNSGIGVVFTNAEDDNGKSQDPIIQPFGVESEQPRGRFRLNANYTNEAGNAGAAVRFQLQDTTFNGTAGAAIPLAYGWFSAFNKILTVKAGIVDDGTWNSVGYFINGDAGEGLGALAKITPIDGLDIGVGAFSQVTGLQYFDEAKYTFNLGYTMPEVVKLTVVYGTKAGHGFPPGQAAISPVSSKLITSVSLLMVPNLTAALELRLDNLQDFGGLKVGDKDAWGREVKEQSQLATNPATPNAEVTATDASGRIDITETFQYDMGSLSVGLWAVESLSQVEEADLALYANPWVSYALGSIVPRLDIGYGYGATNGFGYDGGATGSKWHYKNVTSYYMKEISAISARPSVKFNIDSNTFVEIGDLFNYIMVKDGDSQFHNVFYIDFKWAF